MGGEGFLFFTKLFTNIVSLKMVQFRRPEPQHLSKSTSLIIERCPPHLSLPPMGGEGFSFFTKLFANKVSLKMVQVRRPEPQHLSKESMSV